MTSNGKNQTEILNTYASVLRIPSEIYKPIVAHFVNCINKNGSEWTVSRFKSVKQDFINLKAGKDCESLWVSRKGNTFGFAFGGLQSWCMFSFKRWSAAIQLLQIYSNEISPTVTESQKEKFVSAVTYNNTISDTIMQKYSKMVADATCEWFPKPSWYGNPPPLVEYPVSSTRNEPHANGKSYPEGENTLNCAYSFLDQTVPGQNFVRKYPNLFKPLLEGIIDSDLWSIGNMYHQSSVGKIGVIQEPGFKLRAVANPARVYQAVLKPMGDVLYTKLALLPWDCTHDQSRPFTKIQNHLINNLTAHAIDLSNATDRFPLALQMVMLNKLFHRKDAIDLFFDLSKAKWQCSLTVTGVIQWQTGQPLGLYPSFAAFSLTHGMILYALNGMKHNDSFFVLGDDVIILDDALFKNYMLFLGDMEIPYSPSKTISSSTLSEFGGKLITKEGITPQLKWRHVSDDSFIDLAMNFGERFRRLMRSRQRIIFDMIKIIPEFLGGCGFNPQGIPLDERIDLFYQLQSKENRQSYLMSYNGRLQSMNYSVDTSGDNSWIYSETPTIAFDLNAAHIACKISSNITPFIPIRDDSIWKETLGNPLFVVSPRERMLPIAGSNIRTTTLDVLERKFSTLPRKDMIDLQTNP